MLKKKCTCMFSDWKEYKDLYDTFIGFRGKKYDTRCTWRKCYKCGCVQKYWPTSSLGSPWAPRYNFELVDAIEVDRKHRKHYVWDEVGHKWISKKSTRGRKIVKELRENNNGS